MCQRLPTRALVRLLKRTRARRLVIHFIASLQPLLRILVLHYAAVPDSPNPVSMLELSSDGLLGWVRRHTKAYLQEKPEMGDQTMPSNQDTIHQKLITITTSTSLNISLR